MSARSNSVISTSAAAATPRRPGHARRPPTRTALHALTLAAGLSVGLAACGGAGGGSGRSNAAGPAAPTTATTTSGAGRCPSAARFGGKVNDHGAATASSSPLQIQAGDTFFAPTCETQVPAGTVTLIVHNTGRALHNLTVPGQGIDKDVPAGQTITVQVKIGTATVAYFCKYHRTAGMLGALLPGSG